VIELEIRKINSYQSLAAKSVKQVVYLVAARLRILVSKYKLRGDQHPYVFD
jgi:hypothetical protein